MTTEIERALERWREAGLVEPETLARIAEFEEARGEPRGLRWPVILALVFGGVLLAAGVLLFVAAHWDALSPAGRAALVVAMVAAFHLGGALLERRGDAFATLLHGLGTVSLGAGIYLFGQIFNMREHWPAALGMWAAGAWAGWLVRRDWLQMSLAALLTPAWILSEWAVRFDHVPGAGAAAADAAMILATVYLSARIGAAATPVRRALVWIGGLALIPSAFSVWLANSHWRGDANTAATLGVLAGAILPLPLAWILRREAAWMNAVAATAVVILGFAAQQRGGEGAFTYLWAALCAAGLAAWGVFERRPERINLGIAGFAVTVLGFYFSTLMDKLGRSLSLIVLGLVVLAGGWALEQTRRRLVAGTRAS